MYTKMQVIKVVYIVLKIDGDTAQNIDLIHLTLSIHGYYYAQKVNKRL